MAAAKTPKKDQRFATHQSQPPAPPPMATRRLYSLLGLLLLVAVVYLNWLPVPGGGGGLKLKLPVPWLQPRMAFASRRGTHFVDAATGAPLYLNGWNSYWLLSSRNPALVSEMLRRGRSMGLAVCRTWAFADGGGPGALQIFPGRFSEDVFQELDYVIYEARRNHVRLILCLVNNLDNFGGKAQYVRWAQAAGANVTNSTDSFFYHPTIKGYYKDYVKAILTRRNSYSGIRYCDEPAIFAWELMNEPRCVSNSSGPHLQAWITEMAAYVKSLDSNHLVTVGTEGFYGPGIAERLGFNPGDWAASLCSDFIQNSAVEHIDFASVHAYPDSWLPNASMEEKIRHLSGWVDSHLNDSEHMLKKPVLFSEVGYLQQHADTNSTLDRDIFLRVVYDKIYDSARKLQAGGGALIWQLMVEGTHMYHDNFSLVARDHPSTYKLIKEHSCRLQMLYKKEGDPGWQCSVLP